MNAIDYTNDYQFVKTLTDNDEVLVIPSLSKSCSASFIANTFKKLRIAIISSIALIPVSTGGLVAIIKVKDWFFNPASMNLIRRARNYKKSHAYVVYNDPYKWEIQMMRQEDCKFHACARNISYIYTGYDENDKITDNALFVSDILNITLAPVDVDINAVCTVTREYNPFGYSGDWYETIALIV